LDGRIRLMAALTERLLADHPEEQADDLTDSRHPDRPC
jgi:hypothetical protein